MATESSRGIRTRMLANKWKIVVALIAVPMCGLMILTLINIVQMVVIGRPEWIDVEMGELSPDDSKEAYLDRTADNGYSRIRHIYSYSGQKGQTPRIRVVPGSELYASIMVQKGLHTALGSTPAYTRQSALGVPTELSVILPEDGVYIIIIVGSHAPDYYHISIEVTETQ